MPRPETNREEKALLGNRPTPAAEKNRWVSQQFTSIAGQYDLMNTLLSFGLHYLWKRTAVKILDLKAGDQVIDVCGGTGDLSILAAQDAGPAGRIILYDINRAMIEAGRPKVARSALAERIRYVQGDAELISFPSGQFDAAMVSFGVRNLTRIERGLAEMHRVLKPGGKLVCLEFSLPTSGWIKQLYDVYSFHLIPLAGKLLGGSREAYTYLPESIRGFLRPDELVSLLKQIGFSHVTYRNLTQGIAVVYRGGKFY